MNNSTQIEINKAILTSTEAADFLGIKKSYLFKLTSAGILRFSKPNGKLMYFLKDDLERWMLSNPNRDFSEREIAANTYVSTHK